ncbi:ABR086Wp [Eremothecium gossypii ATCC 10895]|uniref:Mitochondrial inner membrane protease subunit 2 n=1 Tax=Eremothecium gossypii (strain ATCC 10895 / CBS 109.51 / FGSC 9923 / NRRL Y-1056) TaxID=284811 RepID=Q75DE1_EREGS|nr:ABR086Wp [Eremothecium gossypii ATCC 10895]AAS50856.1 ABR086Wp [Eremothecium gossypii ATCC 10895]AEY95145.1 FABR086Wp [Eremothecium gossypii FDAG1]
MFTSRLAKCSLVAVTWLPVYMTVTHHVVFISKVEGPSMRPTLNPMDGVASDWVLVWKLGKTNIRNLNHGDVVIFRSPMNPKKVYCKRIQGKQYDTVRTRYPYPKSTCEVPKSHIWVEGDNVTQSVDSNHFGPISTGLVVGEVTRVIWPPSRWGADLHEGMGRRAVVAS